MNILHSALSSWRDRLAPISHTSTFRSTGQITPEEFVLAGDYLVYKFPTWSWSDASSPGKRVAYLPPDKQFLITRGVPCHRRLEDYINSEGGKEGDEDVVVDDDGKDNQDGGWLNTGGGLSKKPAGDSGNAAGQDEEEEEEEEEEIPDIDDDEDDSEAIIRDTAGKKSDGNSKLRTYTLYITYTPYYRTPRLYLSGYTSRSEPLAPHLMMEDIVGDYHEKTVTLEDFPFFDTSVKMASVHPCKHASVMKVFLDRADAALKQRQQKVDARKEEAAKNASNVSGIIEGTKKLSLNDGGSGSGGGGSNNDDDDASSGIGADDWEVLDACNDEDAEDEVAIRVDQYLIVFVKFIASVTPGIEYDYTMDV